MGRTFYLGASLLPLPPPPPSPFASRSRRSRIFANKASCSSPKRISSAALNFFPLLTPFSTFPPFLPFPPTPPRPGQFPSLPRLLPSSTLPRPLASCLSSSCTLFLFLGAFLGLRPSRTLLPSLSPRPFLPLPSPSSRPPPLVRGALSLPSSLSLVPLTCLRPPLLSSFCACAAPAYRVSRAVRTCTSFTTRFLDAETLPWWQSCRINSTKNRQEGVRERWE
jgi:hypothetical protein